MAWRRLAHVIGAVVAAVGAAMLLPALVAVIYGELGAAWRIGLAGAATGLIGLLSWRYLDPPGKAR